MIDLPGTPGAGSQTTGTPGSAPIADIKSAADLARQQVSQTVQAVVLEAKLVQQATVNGKAVYEILLRANAAPGTAPPLLDAGSAATSAGTPGPANNPLTQITAQAINALRLGQPLLIKTNGEISLPVGTQLLASVSPDKGVVINRILPAQVASTITQALRTLVPQQQSFSPLFQTLEQLITSPPLTKQHSGIQALTASLLQLLPKLEQLKSAEQLRQAMNNSGVFLENKILKAVQQSGVSSTGIQPQSKAASPQILNEGLKQLSQKVKEAVGLKDAAPSNIKAELSTATSGDIKQLLQDLRGKLEQIQNNSKQSVTADTAKPLIKDAGSPAGQPAPPTAGKDIPMQTGDGKAGAVTSPRMQGEGTYRVPDSRAPDGRATDTLRSEVGNTIQRSTNNRIQGYNTVQNSSPSGETPTKSALETYILPPLPGNIVLQPQPRTKHNPSGDMADALVSVLLKQVKGAINRITLHQLASQPRSQDPAAPQPLLSFELPILHQGQIQIFQFLIEEEEKHGEEEDAKQLGKRWVVQMAFDVEGLGPMLCQISMLGNSAAVSFWAEWENTLQHTRKHFDYLQTVLTDMGLRVEKLQGHLGIPKSEQAILQNQLVDIRT